VFDLANLFIFFFEGGLEQQIQEIKESVELPLTHPELYESIGIKPVFFFVCCCCAY
jgi:SpoVK/Ycf46/Vps4 family AAA+-type ATPase